MALRTAYVGLALVALSAPALAQGASSSVPVPSASSLQPAAPTSPDLSDADLERAVRAAYSGAAAFAAAHGNYFARDGVFPPLRDAVAAELLEEGFSAVVVPAVPSADLKSAQVCLGAPGTELRIASTIFGDAVTLVAVSDTRLFAYDYDPHKAADIKVIAATACDRL